MFIKKCPFCGGKAVLTELPRYVAANYAVQCTRCGAVVTGRKGHSALRAWNRRSGPRPRGGKVDAC